VAAVGFTLQPEQRYLELLARPIAEDCDYWEVAPETLWRPRGDGELVPNGFHAQFAALKRSLGREVVAHGVAFSVGSAAREPERRERWLARIRDDVATFDYRWYTDHLGVTRLAGRELTLPLPLPMRDDSAAIVSASLIELQSVVRDVGVENSVFYFHFGDPLDEPRFLRRCLAAPRTHLLLDLHNVFTTAQNCGFDAWDYIERLPLERVIEIHVSGGSDSEAGWLESGAVMRLDGHDNEVPGEVWRLLERTVPLCANLRGVTLERMEGTVEQRDVACLEEELRHVRRIAGGARG
jgi:uncharacterized protein (UPF0276 family)